MDKNFISKTKRIFAVILTASLITGALPFSQSIGILSDTSVTVYAAENLQTEYIVTAGVGGDANGEGDEGYKKLFDGNKNTKWCTTSKAVPEGETQSCYYVDFQTATPSYVEQYVLTTGNDTSYYPGRNPNSWVIKAKLKENDDWTTIATVNNDNKMSSKDYHDTVFQLDVKGIYKYFRFMVSDVKRGNIIQLSEFSFRGDVANSPADLSKATVTGEQVYPYTGETISPQITVTDYMGNIVSPDDYTISGFESEKGSHTLTITANEGSIYNGSATFRYLIVKDLSGNGTQKDPYLIADDSDWEIFAYNISKGINTNGYYKLTNDINISVPVCTEQNKFNGHFNGDGHKITFNGDAFDDVSGVFRYIDGAEISGLTVDGNVSANAGYIGGLVGSVSGNSAISNCVCNSVISSDTNTMGNIGGFVGIAENGSSLNMSECTFSGKLLGKNTENCGGFIGWKDDSASVGLQNCVFAPEELTVSSKGSFTFVRNCYDTFSTCYFTQNLANTQGGNKVSRSQATENTVTVNGVTYYILPQEQKGNITYIDSDGSTKTLTPDEYIILDGTEATANNDICLDSDKFYVVSSDVNYTSAFNQSVSHVKLILCDGCTMSISNGSSQLFGGHGKNITIFGQSMNTGRLDIYASDTCEFSPVSFYKYTQNGGTVTVRNDCGSISYCMYGNIIELNGGSLELNGAYSGAMVTSCANINGGSFSADGGHSGIQFFYDGDWTLNGGTFRSGSFSNYGMATYGHGLLYIKDGIDYFDDAGNIVEHTRFLRYSAANKTLYPHITHKISLTKKGGDNDKCKVFVYPDGAAKKGENINVIVELENYIPQERGWLVKSVTVNGEELKRQTSGYSFQMPYEDVDIEVEFVDYTKVDYKDPTCTQQGNYWHLRGSDGNFYKDVFGTKMTSEEVFIPAKGHNWDDAKYVWTETPDGDWQCTASRSCKTCNETVTETVTAVKSSGREATADETGIILYTATFQNEAFETAYKNFETPLADPIYGEPEYTWEWSDGKYTVTAARHCTNGTTIPDITETVTAGFYQSSSATCSTEGYTTYRARFTDTTNFEEQLKTDIIPKNDDHAVKVEITDFDWDTHKGYAKAYCYNCSKVFVENAEAAVTPNVTKQATDTENGEIIYTVSYTYNGVTASHEFKETVPALNSVAVVENTTYWDEKGVTGYFSLEEALDDANGDTPVVLCQDAEMDSYGFGYGYTHYGWLTIDLNDHTLTINSLTAGDNLTVKNGTLECVFSDFSCGTLTLDNAKMDIITPEKNESSWTDDEGVTHTNVYWENYSTWNSANIILKNNSTLFIPEYISLFDDNYPYDGFHLDIDKTSKVVFDNLSISSSNMEEVNIKTEIEKYLPDGYTIREDDDEDTYCTYIIADGNDQQVTDQVELRPSFVVTWKNYDGSELEKDENVKYGTMPSYDSDTPSKPATAQYTYTFTGWDKVPSPVTNDITYSAVFEQTVNKYTVTWLYPDGSLFKTQTLDYGTQLQSGLEVPQGYNSIYWYDSNGICCPDGKLPAIVKDVTYKAEYSAAKIIDVGTVFYAGDKVDFGASYILVNPGMGWSSNDHNDIQTIEYISYNPMFGQYSFGSGFFPTAFINSVNYGDRSDIGIRVAGGDGTYDDPFTFEIALPDVYYTVTWIDADGNTTSSQVKLGDIPSNDSYNYWSDGTNTYQNGALPHVIGDVVYTADANLKDMAVGTVFHAGDRLNFAEYYIKSDEDNADYYSTNYAQGIHTIGEIRYNKELRKYEIISTQDLFYGNKLDIAHVRSYDYNGYDIGIKITGGTGSYDDPFTFAVDIPETSHTVTWQDQNGTVIETDTDVVFGAQSSFDDQFDIPEGYQLFWSDGKKAYRSTELPLVTGDVTYKADISIKKLAVGTVFRAGDKVDFENYYIRSDEDNSMYYSTNFTQGVHEIGELKYNSDGKYEVLSTTELFGDKLHIAHITSNNFDGGDFFVKVSGGDGSQYDPFTFEILPPDAKDIMTDEFITKGDFADFGEGSYIQVDSYQDHTVSNYIYGVLKVADISYDNGKYDVTVGNNHIRIVSPYYGEDIGIKMDHVSQYGSICFAIVYPADKKYTVTWKDSDGNVINSSEMTITEIPENAAYDHWQDEASKKIYANNALPMVVGDTVYKAVGNTRQLAKGSVLNIDDYLSFTDTYIIEDDIHAAAGKSINGIDTIYSVSYNDYHGQYVFNLSSGISICTASENYRSDNIVLRISDGDGTSENPFRFEAVVSDVAHTVTWRDTDGNVIETDTSVLHGSKAEFNGTIDVPANSDMYWKDDSGYLYSVDNLPKVTEDVTYTALFKYQVVLRKDAVFAAGDKVDFGTGKYIDIDGNISCDIQGLLTISKILYSYGYYTVYSSSGSLISISSADIGNKVCIKVTGGTGTQDDPFTLAVELPDTKHTITWKEADGSVISRDENVPFNSTVSNTAHNYWKDTYGNMYRNDALPKVTEDMTYTSFSVEPKAFQVGTVITFGDLFDFKDNYFIYDDYYSLNIQASNYIQGLHSISYSKYVNSWKQYVFDISGGHHLYVTSDYCGDNIGLAVKSGTGTKDDPFIFQVVPHTVSIRNYDINGINTDTFEVATYRFNPKTVRLPDNPYLDGYDFRGWEVNGLFINNKDSVLAEVGSLVSNDTDIDIRVVYAPRTDSHEAVVTGGTLRDESVPYLTSGSFAPSKQLYAVADAPAENMKFDHWEVSYDNGTTWTIVGYDETYAFRMPAKDIKLKAEFVENTVVTAKMGTAYIESVTKLENNKLSFISIVSVPEGATMLRAGIVAFKASDKTAEHTVPTIDYARFKRYDDTTCQNYTTFKYTWTKGNITNADDVWCVRAYLLYKDTDGIEQTIYGKMVEAKLNDFKS